VTACFSTTFAFILLCLFHTTLDLQAQNASTSAGVSAASPAIIRNVDVRPQADGLAIEIRASAPFVPQGLRLTGPDRLVFDFPGYQLHGSNRTIPVDKGPVQRVRMSLFSAQPPVTRVVVDSKEALKFQMKPAGNNVVIEIVFAKAVDSNASSHPTSAASASSPSTSPATPSSSKSSSSRPSSLTLSTAIPPTATKEIHSTSSAKRSNPPALRTPTHVGTPHVSAQTLQVKAKALSLADLQALENKAKTGDPEAETTLALAYHAAVLLKRDDAESLRLLHKAATRNYMAAEETLGLFAEKGIGVAEPAPGEAMEWFRKAAKQGSLDATTNIALMYADGVGVVKDPTLAIIWFRQAAEGGEGAAQYNLALMYARGEGTPQDYKESLHWLTAAADKDVVPAVMDLGAYYLRPPDGSAADVEHAIHCYEKATDLGSDRAPAILGNIYATSAQGKPDYEQAVKWYRLAADKGQREGQYGLGIRYAYGQGVPVDLQQARWLFAAAADQGLAQAQFNLGAMCEEGSGAPADRSCAAHYYQLAADQGMAKAQYRLGRMLANSKESGSDRVSAYKWLMLAQASVKESSSVLNDLRKSMSEQEVSEADRAVDDWRTEHPEVRQ
jgi:uncharacterized protein